MTVDGIGAIVSRIPGWEQSSAVDLPGGLSNRNYLLDNGEHRAVLKVDQGPRSSPYNSRVNEAQIQTNAADAGLAGRVLFVGDDVYLTEYLEGEVWTETSLEDDVALSALAVALRNLHALPLTGRSFDAALAARQYKELVPGDEAATAADCLALINAMPRLQNLCCCHNDLVVGNIIATPAIQFIDWEYACDNDPFFDLATVVAHHRLSEQRAHYLLDAYFDGDGHRWRDRLMIQVKFYNALLWLWLQARRAEGGSGPAATNDSAAP